MFSGRFVAANPDTTLVHGSIEGMGKGRLGHAWVLLDGGAVWEPTTGSEYDPETFARVFSPEEHHRYSIGALMTWTQRTEHWGPWEEPPADVTPYRR